jgi:hypothetical protein
MKRAMETGERSRTFEFCHFIFHFAATAFFLPTIAGTPSLTNSNFFPQASSYFQKKCHATQEKKLHQHLIFPFTGPSSRRPSAI